jgi:NADH dehydrogenase [ubiquinone] 1 alpha subcomplex assembly factor 5
MRLAKPLSISARTLASAASDGPFNPHSVGPFQVFDRHAKRLQKDRAAARDGGARSRTVDYVREEVAERLIERMLVSLLLSSMQRGKEVE